MTTYHLVMDNGLSLDVRADSAGEAIYQALHRVRGMGVAQCYAGGETDPGTVRLDGEGTGRVTFEVPKHDPLPVVPLPGRQKMCAKHVQVGDILEKDVFDWEITAIEPLGVMLMFEAEDAKNRNHTGAFRVRPDDLYTVVRADTPRSRRHAGAHVRA